MRTLLLVLLLALAAGAQAPKPTPPPPRPNLPPEPVAVRAELVQVSDEGLAGLDGHSLIPEGYWERNGRGRVVQRMELMSVTGKDAYVMFGHKSPVIYFDPRSTQFQVQYVDVGCKLDMVVDFETENTYKIEARSEFSRLERQRTYGVAPGPVASYPQVLVTTSNVGLNAVKPGQSYMIGRTDASVTRRWLDLLGIQGGAERLVLVLTLLKRP